MPPHGGHHHRGGGGWRGPMYIGQSSPSVYIVDRAPCRCVNRSSGAAVGNCRCSSLDYSMGEYVLEGDVAPESMGIGMALVIGVGLWWWLGRGKAV